MNHEEVLAPPTPSGSASSSSNASPMSVSEIGQETLSAVASAETSVGHVHDFADEAVRGGRVPMHASLAEFAAISNMGGRDGYVKALAGNPGYTRDKSRKRSDYDNDGIIYVILNRSNLKVYVGQTDNVDVRFREHLGGYGRARVLQSAIAKYGPHRGCDSSGRHPGPDRA